MHASPPGACCRCGLLPTNCLVFWIPHGSPINCFVLEFPHGSPALGIWISKRFLIQMEQDRVCSFLVRMLLVHVRSCTENHQCPLTGTLQAHQNVPSFRHMGLGLAPNMLRWAFLGFRGPPGHYEKDWVTHLILCCVCFVHIYTYKCVCCCFLAFVHSDMCMCINTYIYICIYISYVYLWHVW